MQVGYEDKLARINTNGDPELGTQKTLLILFCQSITFFRRRAASFKTMESVATLSMQTARLA